MNIMAYGYKNYEEKTKSKFKFGFEVEIQTNREKLVAHILSQFKNYIVLKEDGSLDEGGFEIVSHILSLKHMNIIKKLESVLDELEIQGIISREYENYGLHIHISREYLSEKDLINFIYFIEKEENFFSKVSKREYYELREWCRFYDTIDEEEIKMIIHNANDRYRAINLTNEKTIEFRLFHTSFRLTYAILLVKYIIDFCKTKNKKKLNRHDFLRFLLNKNQKLYDYVKTTAWLRS